MTRGVPAGFQMPPASKLLGWQLLEAKPEEGVVRVGFEGQPEFCNPSGFIQGGILSAMLDDTMGSVTLFMTAGRLYAPTVSMTVNFLAPGKVGAFVCEAKVVQMGKTVAFVEARLTDAAGTLVATASSTSRLVETARVIREANDPSQKKTPA